MNINGIPAIMIKLGDPLYFQDSANGQNLFAKSRILHAELTDENGKKWITCVKVGDKLCEPIMHEKAG